MPALCLIYYFIYFCLFIKEETSCFCGFFFSISVLSAIFPFQCLFFPFQLNFLFIVNILLIIFAMFNQLKLFVMENLNYLVVELAEVHFLEKSITLYSRTLASFFIKDDAVTYCKELCERGQNCQVYHLKS